jgi:type IV secretory pathway TrbD component
MKTVYIVEAPDTPHPRFPDRCVICGQPRSEPLTTMVIGDEVSLVDFAFYSIIRTPSQGKLLHIPIHDACAESLRNRLLMRTGRLLLTLAALIAAGLYFQVNFWITLFASVVIVMPFVSIALSKPPPVEFGYGGEHYAIVFADPQSAREFARMHNADIVEAGYRGGDYIRKHRKMSR